MRTRIWCPRFSNSAKALSQATEIKRLRWRTPSQFKYRWNDVIINWGSTIVPSGMYNNSYIINDPLAVEFAVDKRLTFSLLESVHLEDEKVTIPKWTLDNKEAQDWSDEGSKIVGRSSIKGCAGEGIMLYSPGDCISNHLLYTKYIPRDKEYRVHVFDDVVIRVQEKRRSYSFNDNQVNWQIRTHDNGFVFATEYSEPIPSVINLEAKKAIKALGLDFGAVDIGYRSSKDTAYVFEINTAPNLKGTTLEIYKDAIQSFLLRLTQTQ
tara:strand:- start:12605 stop:13402 length:798 start_codon:yes stop_codon:yes gene_type:complete